MYWTCRGLPLSGVLQVTSWIPLARFTILQVLPITTQQQSLIDILRCRMDADTKRSTAYIFFKLCKPYTSVDSLYVFCLDFRLLASVAQALASHKGLTEQDKCFLRFTTSRLLLPRFPPLPYYLVFALPGAPRIHAHSLLNLISPQYSLHSLFSKPNSVNLIPASILATLCNTHC